jgi:hypothetical protein
MRIRWPAAAVCALAAAAPAQAAWTPPVRLGPPAHYPDIVMARDGHALVTAFSSRDDTQLVTLAPGGMEPIARRIVSGRPWFRTYGRSSTIGLRARDGVLFGTIADPLGRVEGSRVASDLAVSPRGDAVVMWGERRGRLWLTRYSVRPPGGRFLKPRTIAVARGYDEFWGDFETGDLGQAVAIDDDGDVTIALEHHFGASRNHRREVRVVTIRRGMRPGAQQSLAPHSGFVSVALAVAAKGRTAIAWRTSHAPEDGDLPTEVWAATRRPASRRFGPAQRLEAHTPSSVAGRSSLDLALGADGEALVAWTARTRFGRAAVEVAAAPAAKRFGPSQTAGVNAIEPDVALAPDGRAALTWVSSYERELTSQVFAALRPRRGAAFGSPEPVSPPEAADYPVVAYDPSTAQPLIAWSATPGAPNGFEADGTPARRSLSVARFVP